MVLVKLVFLSRLPMVLGSLWPQIELHEKLNCGLGWPLNHLELSALGDVMLETRYAVTEWLKTSETYVRHVIKRSLQ